jgi:thymidylate kinase
MVVPQTRSLPIGSPADRVDQRSLTRAALVALDRAEVKWCLVRASTGGRDLDILVAADDLATAVAVLRRHGLRRLGGYLRTAEAFLVGFDDRTGTWAQLDLVTALSFGRHGEVRVESAQACLGRRRREGGVWMLAEEDEFWVLLLHCLLDKGVLADRHLRRLRRLTQLASLESPVADAMPPWVPRAQLLRQARTGDWAAVAAAGAALQRASRRIDTPSAALTSAVALARSVALRIGGPLLVASRQRGLSVALIGPDGAGKSTLAAGIESSFYFPVRKIYMGLWPRSGAPPQGPAGKALRIARRPIVVWGRYLAALWHQTQGRLVVFDRYVYDARLPPHGSWIWLKRPYLWLLSRACLPPNLVIMLDAPGDVMHARCGDRDRAELEAEREEFRRITAGMRRATRVDSDRPTQEVLADVIGQIWRQYLGRAGR